MGKELVFPLVIIVSLSLLVYVEFSPIAVKCTNNHPVHNLNTNLNYTTIQEAIDDNETLDGHTIFVEEGTYYENVVVDKALTLIGESENSTIVNGSNYGNVFYLFQVDNVSISGFTIRNSGHTSGDSGILVSYSSNVTVFNNIISENNWNGIYLISSNNNNISHNSITDNVHQGIYLTTSSRNVIFGNCVTDNHRGLSLLQSHNNTLSDNVVSNGVDGVYLVRSNGNILLNNLLSDNTDIGIALGFSKDCTLRNNIITSSLHNFGIAFSELEHFYNDVDISNTVDGKPVYYWIGKHHDEVPANAGCVTLVNCSNIAVKNLKLENNIHGIVLANTNNTRIIHSNITKNNRGITLAMSYNNTVKGNTLANNIWCAIQFTENSYNNAAIGNVIADNWGGIFLDYSFNNTIFHNNFINNTEQVYSYASTNVWDNGLEGNFWSDYNDTDADHDGIGESPFIIGIDNRDSYPLMGIFSSFNISTGRTVDVVSNSTIEGFQYFQGNRTIKMFVSNMTSDQTSGFCRVTIPYTLMNVTDIFVTVNKGKTPLLYHNYTLFDNGTHRWIYFAYPHSTHEIDIVPEFPPVLVLLLFMIALTQTVIVCRRLP